MIVHFFFLAFISIISTFTHGLSINGKNVKTSNFGITESCNRRIAIQSSIVSTLAVIVNDPLQSLAANIDPSEAVVTKRVFFDVEIKEKKLGRIVIGLYGEVMPKLTENFEKLCEQNSYAGTTFYRVLPGLTIQGGAIGDPTGKTGKSAFGNPFEPDNYDIKHTKFGLVSAVRGLGGSVDSRFFINTKDDAGWADERYAVFGIVEEGLSIVKDIEKVNVQPPKNMPKVPVKIVLSGIVSPIPAGSTDSPVSNSRTDAPTSAGPTDAPVFGQTDTPVSAGPTNRPTSTPTS